MTPRSRAHPDSDAVLTPPLKWAGGKRWLVPYLHSLGIWEKHSHRRLVEPLCGGLAVALSLNPRRALLNDVNPHLINFYTWVKKGLRPTVRMKNDKGAYYAARDRFNTLIASGDGRSKTAAELFYYLNRTGYNGLCRFNSRGEFNVPFGRYTTINYRRDFLAYRRPFSRWTFTAMDFEEMRIRRDDFIYADPPYDTGTGAVLERMILPIIRRGDGARTVGEGGPLLIPRGGRTVDVQAAEFTGYAGRGFRWADQVRLARWLARHSGPVVLSNQATERIVRLYKGLGFALRFLRGPRMISCTGDRTPAVEVLATKGV